MIYSSSHLSGVHLNSTLTSDRILNLYLMSLRTAIIINLKRYSYYGGKQAVVMQFSRGCPHLCNYLRQHGILSLATWVTDFEDVTDRDFVRYLRQLLWYNPDQIIRCMLQK